MRCFLPAGLSGQQGNGGGEEDGRSARRLSGLGRPTVGHVGRVRGRQQEGCVSVKEGITASAPSGLTVIASTSAAAISGQSLGRPVLTD